MTFAKLFGSILDSTVWQTPKHVRLVWITMLAMKDRDGIVEAAIPGLARRAGVELAECEEALQMLMSPDPYSRTPDYEGRRIVIVDGGWRVLNHDKYRDKFDKEERREKETARKARQRDRRKPGQAGTRRDNTGLSRNVPRGPAMSAHAETETDPFPEEARSGSGKGIDPVSSQPPDQSGSGDREQPPWSERWEATQRPTASPQRAQAPDPTDARANERKRLLRALVDAHALIFNRVRDEIAAQVPAMRPAGLGDPAERELQALLDIQVTLDGFEARARHVLAVREDEARRKRTVKFLGPSLWRPSQFGIAGSMQIGEDRTGSGESVFDAVDRGIDVAIKAGVISDEG